MNIFIKNYLTFKKDFNIKKEKLIIKLLNLINLFLKHKIILINEN